MSDTVIKIENLSKRYIIGHETGVPYLTLRDMLTSAASKFNPINWYLKDNIEHSTKEEFWALKDINLEIKQGEKIGIIGRNGAGKSTLLKILSRITEPTTGSIKIKGRVASLLEVGTGFHPELTGRENIFLNGSILGMKKSEIKSKFDEIVDFSGVEKFLDTPVKRYSSGMYVRLAFAVAAHLEPEILLIDEVLAVGDAEFQKKCLGKMDDVAKQGRTILFVSHNMAAVEKLCTSSVVLDSGRIKFDGGVNKAIKYYYNNQENIINGGNLNYINKIKNNLDMNIIEFSMQNSKQEMIQNIKINETATFRILLHSKIQDSGYSFRITMFDINEQRIAVFDSKFLNKTYTLNIGNNEILCVLSSQLSIKPGTYKINVSVKKNNIVIEHIISAIRINVIESDFYHSGKFPEKDIPLFFINHSWD